MLFVMFFFFKTFMEIWVKDERLRASGAPSEIKEETSKPKCG